MQCSVSTLASDAAPDRPASAAWRSTVASWVATLHCSVNGFHYQLQGFAFGDLWCFTAHCASEWVHVMDECWVATHRYGHRALVQITSIIRSALLKTRNNALEGLLETWEWDYMSTPHDNMSLRKKWNVRIHRKKDDTECCNMQCVSGGVNRGLTSSKCRPHRTDDSRWRQHASSKQEKREGVSRRVTREATRRQKASRRAVEEGAHHSFWCFLLSLHTTQSTSTQTHTERVRREQLLTRSVAACTRYQRRVWRHTGNSRMKYMYRVYSNFAVYLVAVNLKPVPIQIQQLNVHVSKTTTEPNRENEQKSLRSCNMLSCHSSRAHRC